MKYGAELVVVSHENMTTAKETAEVHHLAIDKAHFCSWSFPAWTILRPSHQLNLEYEKKSLDNPMNTWPL